ncbi:MAG: hypothetical protein HQ567_23555 [Candidatus Nealsonbacteria bacterium]|nr:hypothetical protein [Candidatus Nealsonbacteria bacterium]
MMETHHNEEMYGEMDLGEILRELYRWKWLIFGITLLVGLTAAAITLMKPNAHESSAALIIREPELPITGEAPTLSIETLQTLTDSTEIM